MIYEDVLTLLAETTVDPRLRPRRLSAVSVDDLPTYTRRARTGMEEVLESGTLSQEGLRDDANTDATISSQGMEGLPPVYTRSQASIDDLELGLRRSSVALEDVQQPLQAVISPVKKPDTEPPAYKI